MGAPAAAVIQARLSSTRLPRKVLLPLAGRPVLFHVLERLRQVPELARIVVATSTSPDDDELELACRTLGVDCMRGPLDDVLGRYRQAVEALAEQAIVRVAADKPLLVPRLMSRVIEHHLNTNADYTTNMGAGWPDDAACVIGHEVEVVSRAALLRADAEANSPADREHVLPYIYAGPADFRVERVALPDPLAPLAPRLVLDTAADYELLSAVYDALYRDAAPIDERAVVELLKARPELAGINSSVRQRGYR